MMSAGKRVLEFSGGRISEQTQVFFWIFVCGTFQKLCEMQPDGIKADFSVAGMTVFSPLVHDSQPAVCGPEEAACGLAILWKTAIP